MVRCHIITEVMDHFITEWDGVGESFRVPTFGCKMNPICFDRGRSSWIDHPIVGGVERGCRFWHYAVRDLWGVHLLWWYVMMLKCCVRGGGKIQKWIYNVNNVWLSVVFMFMFHITLGLRLPKHSTNPVSLARRGVHWHLPKRPTCCWVC